MGRTQVIFKCVIDASETATHGPICGRPKCARLFECLPIQKQDMINNIYEELRQDYADDMIHKLVVKDEIEKMQWFAGRMIEKRRRYNRNIETLFCTDDDEPTEEEVTVPVCDVPIISEEYVCEREPDDLDILDIQVMLVRKKGDPYVLDEKISIPNKIYKTPDDLIYEINRSVKLRGVRNGGIYTISFDAKKKKLFAHNHHRQPRGSTLTIKPIGEKIAALGLIQQESLPLRNGAKLYFHNSPSSAILAME